MERCSLDRYFVESLEIKGDDLHHLLRTQRHRAGDMIEIVWEGRLYRTSIDSIDKDAAHLCIQEEVVIERRAPVMRVYQASVEKKKAEQVIKTCTQVGCQQFFFFDAQRSSPGKNEVDEKRASAISREAAMQSKQVHVPTIQWHMSFDALCRQVTAEKNAFLLYEAEESCSLVQGISMPGSPSLMKDGLSVIVGPEGGFSEEERCRLASCGARSVRMFSGILRTELAAFAALSVISAFCYASEGRDEDRPH